MNRSHHSARWIRLAIATFIVALLAFPQACTVAQSSTSTASLSLTVSLDWSPVFTPLDPLTLEDIPGAAPMAWLSDLPKDYYPDFAVSADGSTSVYIQTVGGTTGFSATVHDGWGGAHRLSIPLNEHLSISNLGQDGQYLTLEAGIGCGPSGCGARTWKTYDTITGALIATTVAADRNPAWPTMFSPDGIRAYDPVYDLPIGSTAVTASGPWPLSIVTYDLLTGKEAARLQVPEIVGGNWPGDTIDGMYVGLFEDPGIALSPDGASIAVIDSGLEQLVVIDTNSMEVRDVQEISQSTSLIDGVLTWLGIAPQEAEAKVGSGRRLEVQWSADGQSLYVTGHETTLDGETTVVSGSGFGLTRIDASSGDILDQKWEGQVVDGYSMVVAPDGESLYVVVSSIPWWEPEAEADALHVIYRLDPENLEILAERQFAL